jgi:hypothetical protein
MELENIILSEVRKAQKAKNHMISLANAVVLLDMGHTLRGKHTREK